MHFSVVLPVLSAATFVLTQNPIIEVGGAADLPDLSSFRFFPSTLSNIIDGTTITFRFTGAPGNHSITQSSFEDPCNPIPGGFDSGWVSIPFGNVSTPPEWNLTITDDTAPIWFFCKQFLPISHCSIGMVGAINPPSSGNTFTAFQSNAANFVGVPNQGEGGLVGIGASASAGPGPAVAGVLFYTGTPLPTPAEEPSTAQSQTTSFSPQSQITPQIGPVPPANESSHRMLLGVIIGPVLAGVIIVVLVLLYGNKIFSRLSNTVNQFALAQIHAQVPTNDLSQVGVSTTFHSAVQAPVTTFRNEQWWMQFWHTEPEIVEAASPPLSHQPIQHSLAPHAAQQRLSHHSVETVVVDSQIYEQEETVLARQEETEEIYHNQSGAQTGALLRQMVTTTHSRWSNEHGQYQENEEHVSMAISTTVV